MASESDCYVEDEESEEDSEESESVGESSEGEYYDDDDDDYCSEDANKFTGYKEYENTKDSSKRDPFNIVSGRFMLIDRDLFKQETIDMIEGYMRKHLANNRKLISEANENLGLLYHFGHARETAAIQKQNKN